MADARAVVLPLVMCALCALHPSIDAQDNAINEDFSDWNLESLDDFHVPHRRSLLPRAASKSAADPVLLNPPLVMPLWVAQFRTQMILSQMKILGSDLFITGSFKQNIRVGDSQLTSQGSLDMFAAKISTTGTWQTFFSLGGTWADSGEGITVDDQYMYVSARLGSKLAGNTAPVKLSIMGRNATTVPLPAPGVVIKIEHTLDTSTSASARSGSRVKWISPSSSGTVPNNMAIDFDGSLLVVGRVESAGLQTFGSGPGAAVVNFGTCSSTGHCVYLEKISSTGTVLWALSLVRNPEYGRNYRVSHIATLDLPREEPSMIISGMYGVGAVFVGENTTSQVGRVENFGDVFLAKVTSSGSLIYIRTSRTKYGGVVAYGMTVNVNNIVFIVGAQSGTSTFGNQILQVIGTNEAAFVYKFNPYGQGSWEGGFHLLESSYNSYARSVAADLIGNPIILGDWFSTATFGGTNGGLTIRTNGSSDVFVVKCNTVGTMLWAANAVKGYGANQASTIVADAFVTKFYIIGAFKRLAYFGFSPNQKFTMTSAAGTDISDGFLLGMEDAGAPGASMALLTRAYMSSRDPDDSIGRRGDPHKAVDGNPNPLFLEGSCARTFRQTMPWWYADLGQEINVGYVRVYNQEGRDFDQLADFEIRIGNRPIVNSRENPICQTGLSLNSSGIGIYRCNMVGRYVVIRIADIYRVEAAVLTLCEVEVIVGPEYQGCMAAPSGGVTIPSNVFPDWPKTTDDMLEVCSSVCRGATQSKLFGLPPSEILNEDTVGTTGECYCAVGPPSANEAAVPSEECTAVRIFRNMQREDYPSNAPPTPYPPPQVPFPPNVPPLPPFPPSPPSKPPSPPKQVLDTGWIAIVAGGCVATFVCCIVTPIWYHARVKGLVDPFYTKRNRRHDKTDPDQEINSANIVDNPAWRGKVWNGMTFQSDNVDAYIEVANMSPQRSQDSGSDLGNGRHPTSNSNEAGPSGVGYMDEGPHPGTRM